MRLLRRAPGFAAAAIATIALGVGSATAMFSVVDAVLLEDLRFEDPQRLAMIRPTSGSRLSAAYLHEWRLANRTFEDMAGWRDMRANLTGRGVPQELQADAVTANFFAVLGAPALVGRTFTVAADLSRIEPEVVLSYGLWQRAYGADPAVVGQRMTLDSRPLTIVGVMPADFTIRTTELAESRAELWTPFSLVPGDPTGMGGELNVVARVGLSTSFPQARADLSGIAGRIEREHPSYSRDWGVEVIPLLEATVRDVRLALLVLFGGVVILLLIACSNVASLMLGRAATRQVELAIRSSLGATTGRLVRQSLTEALVLAAAGGLLGVLLAAWATTLLVARAPADLNLPRIQAVGVDARVMAFALAATALTAGLVGLLPAVGVAWPRRVSRGSSGHGTSGAGAALVVSEVALALVLLAGAGLLGRSLLALNGVDPGFRADGVLTMRTTLDASRYDTPERIRDFSRTLLERIEHLPGVEAVGFANYLPMSRFGAAQRFEIDARPDVGIEDRKIPWVSVVGGRYFEVMGIPLVRGRLPGSADTELSEPVFVIDEELARRHWANRDPIGERITWDLGDDRTLGGRVVGIVGRVHWMGMAQQAPASAYWWFPNAPGRDLVVVARTNGDSVWARIAREVGDVDPNQPVADVRPLGALVAAHLAQPRFTLWLLAGFALAALLLTAVGLYGVVALDVARRTREVGIRVALGAQRGDVLRSMMQRGMWMTTAGVALGVPAALAVGRLMTSLLYGVSPTDPATLVLAASFLGVVATLATLLPARRATRLSPVTALRAE